MKSPVFEYSVNYITRNMKLATEISSFVSSQMVVACSNCWNML